MTFKLPALPFEASQVAGWLSQETLTFHHDRHHRAYVEKLNSLVKGSSFENATLEEIVRKSDGVLFNNAAQAWNHTFYWLGIGHASVGAAAPLLAKFPSLKKAVVESFGTVDLLLEEFSRSAVSFFGSGWVWLVQNEKGGELEIMQTSNAENPMRLGKKPLLVCDVWEHAYYIDYRNARGKYVDGFVRSINWSFVSENLERPATCDLTGLMMVDAALPYDIRAAG
jgi:Fe-Mn family superoxide dismutase